MNSNKNIEDSSAEITLELTPEENERNMMGNILWNRDMIVESAISSVIGARESQQDSCYVDVEEDGNAIGIICDGMGGLAGGEIASQNAVRMFIEDYEQVRHELTNFYSFFLEEMIEIDSMVAELTDEAGNLLSAGTTLVAVSVKNGNFQWISVGDSKIYILRGDSVYSMAMEHNYLTLLNQRLREGSISEEEYASEVGRGAALISYLGMGNISLMDAYPQPIPLMDGDIILLCSDGLYKALTERQITETVHSYPGNLDAAASALQEQAAMVAGVTQDNTSIVMLSYRARD